MLNKVILMGRLTADPVQRSTQSGVAATSFTLAVTRNYKKQGEQPETDFIDCVAWRNTAEFIAKYFKKGQLAAVEGALQARIWQDKDGKNRKTMEILVDQMHFAESKREQPSTSDADGPWPAKNDSDLDCSSDDDLPF